MFVNSQFYERRKSGTRILPYRCFSHTTYLCNLCLMDFHVVLGILKTSANLNKMYFTIFYQTWFNIFLVCYEILFIIIINILSKFSLFCYFLEKNCSSCMRFVSHRVDTTRNSKIACVKLQAINRMKKRIVWTQPNITNSG